MGCKNVEEETGRKKETGERVHVEMKPSLKAKLGQGIASSATAFKSDPAGVRYARKATWRSSINNHSCFTSILGT